MAIKIVRFDPDTAYKAHEGTILALPVIPKEMKAPFKHQYGYLTNNRAMAGHAHPTDEIYIVNGGTGYVMVGGKVRHVKAGDVIAIPRNVWHTMLCTERDEAPFLWAALWWDAIEGNTPSDEIDVLAFEKKTAHKAHQDTILASPVVPSSIKAPFDHAYGYLEDGGVMELHKHPTQEVFIVYSGCGFVVVEDEEVEVHPGDVIEIPPNKLHTMKGKPGAPFLWAALWWPSMEG